MKSKNNPNPESGTVSGLLISTIVLVLIVLVLGSVMIWALVNYFDQKNNVDAKINAAVTTAKKEQSIADEAQFVEREKQPTRQLVGPDDLGRVTLSYPKTWSVYVGEQGDTYEAYLHPGSVPPLDSDTPYALRVTVENRSYDQIVRNYENQVKKGELKSSAIEINSTKGNRLDGTFSKTVKGSMVIFKVRDKTLRVYTESEAYLKDFNEIVLDSLTFNP